ncbi:helix-turn-helix transcriptional regulator [Haloarchaeobius litoreus]|uniref:Helix-turn-helix transcriptional regulator n=1 Tax=Haloarchaeobius litoreus TaxID=755306 RepID=A0ABD6DFD9_9EURY|nr:helix-turn-helix domain-containing protein [Haloarchaeobius litoreus]
MDESESDAAISLLRRRPVLSACSGSAVTRRQLTETTGISRATVYRATVALEERGVLERADGGYRTTARGEALLASSDHFLTAIDTVDRIVPLLELVDHPDLTRNAHLLGDAEVTVADASNPYRVVDRVTERFEETTRSRGTIASPTASEAMSRASHSLADKEHIERIFTASALETHETVSGDEFRDVITADSLSIYVADDEAVPFSFAIDDDDVTIVGHDPATGLPTVHVESDRPAARTWLEGVYEECRGKARPM